MHEPLIRREAEADITAIQRLVTRSFAGADFTSHQEQSTIDALRDADILAVSQVAIVTPHVAGYVAAAPVRIADGTGGWYGIGPIAVDPDFQGRGIGAALMESALQILHEGGAGGAVALGDPNFYGRFGFQVIDGLYYPDAPEGYFMARNLGDVSIPQGEVSYHPAFGTHIKTERT